MKLAFRITIISWELVARTCTSNLPIIEHPGHFLPSKEGYDECNLASTKKQPPRLDLTANMTTVFTTFAQTK